MDKKWDGFYTSQKRLQRFPAMIELGSEYTVRMSGTEPKEMRFGLRAASKEGTVKVTIPYTAANAYTVKADGKVIEENEWDDDINEPEHLSTHNCGENRFVSGSANFMEFIITPDCTITIKPSNAPIVGKVRMNWNMDDFWKEGGTTAFVDRVASVLGIDSSRIYTIQQYKGSVIVEFAISAPHLSSDSQSQENKYENKIF